MPQIVRHAGTAQGPLSFWNLSPEEPELASAPAVPVPPIDDSATGIDELAFLLATDYLSTLEKIWLLEQWRYDMLLLDVASSEGLATGRDDGALLQQINKALLLLARYRLRH